MTTHAVAITNAQKVERKTVLPHKLNLTSKPQHTHTLGQILATRHIKGGNTKCTK